MKLIYCNAPCTEDLCKMTSHFCGSYFPLPTIRIQGEGANAH